MSHMLRKQSYLTAWRQDTPGLARTRPGAHIFEINEIARGTIPVSALGVPVVQIESAPAERLASAAKHLVRVTTADARAPCYNNTEVRTGS